MGLRWVMLAVLLSAGAPGCLSVPGSSVGDGDGDGDDAGASDSGEIMGPVRRRIELSATLGGDVTEVPIAIRLTDDSLFANRAAANGSDLRVHDASGSQLPHAIELIDVAGGNLVLWTRVTSLSPGQTVLYLHYGGTPPGTNDPNAVFADASMVWHLDQVDEVKDSAGNNDGITMNAPSPGVGVFGAGMTATAAARVETATAPDIYPENSSWTMMFWVSTSQLSETPMTLGVTDGSGFGAELVAGAQWQARFHQQMGISLLDLGDLSSATFRHVALVVRRPAMTDLEAYVDGSRVDADIGVLAVVNFVDSAPLTIGEGIAGTFDEVRVYKKALSTSEIAVAYQSGLPSFVTVSPTEEASEYPSQ